MEPVKQFFIPGIIFLLTLAFGFWLSRAGKPYNGLLFNVHKLLALAGVILAGIQLNKMLRPFDGLLILMLVLLGLCVIALFASGALMSAGKLDYARMLTVHRVGLLFLGIGLGIVSVVLKSSP